ncbi:7711_t:CDS:2, partial [Acaulospora morrowiae]
MAGLQNSNKLFTDSSNTNPALTTASTHYSQPPRHPTTPTSPPLSNTTTSPRSSSETLRSNKGNNKTSPTTTTTSTNSTPPSNPTSSAASRSLTSTATQTTPQPHSAFSPYNQVPQHPTPVTTPTTTKNSLSQSEPPTMMTTSHLDNSGSTALIYPQQHPHFANSSTTHFWPSWNFNGGNPPNGAAVLPTTGGSAFVPAVGYGTGSNMAPGHNPRPKLTTTIWEDEGTLCYQVDARGICVARRQDNNMINGTKLLNVVGMSRGKRDGILKNEKGRVVVKVGAMHLKGVWITFARAKTLATQFKISELLYPLFVDDPS